MRWTNFVYWRERFIKAKLDPLCNSRCRRPLNASCMRNLHERKVDSDGGVCPARERERWAVAPLGFSPWHLISPAPQLSRGNISCMCWLSAQNLKERDTYPTEILTTVPCHSDASESMIYLGVWRALVPLKRRAFNIYSKFAYLRARRAQSVWWQQRVIFNWVRARVIYVGR